MQGPAFDMSRGSRAPAISSGKTKAAAPPALKAELIDVADMPGLRTAWRDLYDRSLEQNIFLDPDFALPALAYLHPHGLKMLAVFDAMPQRRLLALTPITPPRLPGGLARLYLHKQAALGLPLLDRTLAAPALATLVDTAKTLPFAPGALIFSDIPRDGPTFELLRDMFGEDRRHLLGQYERAALLPAAPDASIDRKTKASKNATRLFRRLAERGALSYRVARDGDVAPAMAEFLALESNGWKGASKTALASTPARARFANSMAENLARAGKLRIESLDLDGKPVAMGIVIEDNGTAYFWKTAYDEAYAALSPGVLFVRELTGRLTAGGAPLKIDSCATPDHPMIDHLWPQRIAMLDLALALAPGWRGRAAVAADSLRRGLRKTAKNLLRRDASGKATIGKIGNTWRARS